jgi:hypothetical protein
MTVADNTSRNQYTATSGQTVFAYTFEIVDKDDIVVLKNGTTLSEGTNYTVSNVGNDSGGNVTLTVGATTGDILTLYRDMPYARTQNYTNSGDFLASEVNSDFDNLWLAGEQTNRSFSQSIRKPITDSDSISMELPAAATRTDSFLTFDSTGAVSTSPLSSALSPSIIVRQQFTGNGSTTVFTLSADPGSPAGVVIYIDGVYQEEGTYSVSGSTVTFTEAPPTNASIEVVSYKTTAVGTTDANSVTYLPAGTGAVQTTVQTKLRESVSVKDFGAVGDGVTDDTAAIQAALDLLQAQTIGKVFFPKGTYAHTGLTIAVSAYLDNFIIEGENPKSTILKNTSTGSGLTIGGTLGSEPVYGEIKSIQILGSSSSNHGIQVSEAGRILFEDVWSISNGGSGFHYTNAWSPTFIRCRADDNDEYGIYLKGGTNHDINGAYFEGGAYSANTLDGIYIEAATDDDTISGELINVGFSNNIRNGIWCKTPALRVIGCFFEFNNNSGLKIGDSADARSLTGATVINSFFDALNSGGTNYEAILIEEANGVSIDGCNFKNVTSAIDIDSASKNITIGSLCINRKSGTVTNIADVNGTLIVDNTEPLVIRTEIVQLGNASVNKYQVESGTSGFRFDIEGNGATASSTLFRLLKDGSVLAGMRNDGRLILDGAISTSGTPSTIQNKIEVYDASGVSLGWIPIYANF